MWHRIVPQFCSRMWRKAQERVSRVEAENAATLASACEDAEGLAQKIAHGLFGFAADAEQQREESKRAHQEQFEEPTLLHTRGSELCLSIICPPRVRNQLLEGMRIATLCHAEIAGKLATLWVVVSSATEFVLGCSPMKPSMWKLWTS
jgi:hypothetical protein